jgi:hypothetical protein
MGGIQNELSERVYPRDAVIPEFTWIKAPRPRPPKVSISRDRVHVRAVWTEQGSRKAIWFIVYAKDRNGWSYSILPASDRSITLSADRKIERITVTSVDRLGRESATR